MAEQGSQHCAAPAAREAPVEFWACALQYAHDSSSGERLNVGELLLAPAARYIGFRITPRYQRLSQAFPGFEHDGYVAYIRRLEERFDEVKESVESDLRAPDGLTLDEVAHRLLLDRGLCFRLGPIASGVTSDPDAELTRRFATMVPELPDRSRPRTSADQLWRFFSSRPSAAHVVPRLVAHHVRNNCFERRFDHTYTNGRLHIVQPLPLGFAQAQYVEKACQQWFGIATALEHTEGAHTWFLVDPPTNGGSVLRAYGTGVNLLRSVVGNRLFDRDTADTLSDSLAAMMAR